MGWESRVYLAKQRIAAETIEETYSEMCKRFGEPSDYDDDGDTFPFARFRLRLGKEIAGMYLGIRSEDVGRSRQDLDEADACMDEWANLLGGSISEEEWNERAERAQEQAREKRKLPKRGPADTVCYFAFDAEGRELGKKSIATEIAKYMKPQLLEPNWLREHAIVRIEHISYGAEGTVSDHRSYDVHADGTMHLLEDE